jgi:hypothetical protein
MHAFFALHVAFANAAAAYSYNDDLLAAMLEEHAKIAAGQDGVSSVDTLVDELNAAYDADVDVCAGDEEHAENVMGRTLLRRAIDELAEEQNTTGMLTLWQAIMQRMRACEELYG